MLWKPREGRRLQEETENAGAWGSFALRRVELLPAEGMEGLVLCQRAARCGIGGVTKELLCVATDPLGDAADSDTAGAFGLPGLLPVEPRGAGDVEMNPRCVACELLEEHGAGDGSAVARAAG